MPSNRETKWKRFFWSRWFMFSAGVLLLFVIFAFGRAYYRDYLVRQEIRRLQAEVDRLETKKLETVELLKYVQSPEFVQNKARVELNMVEPGEQVVIIDNSGAGVQTSGQAEIKVVESNKLSNPVRWWKFFAGK